jgi:glucose-6-phosphate isomerase
MTDTTASTPFEVHVPEPVARATAAALDRLVADRVASRLDAGDPTVWGPEAEAEASIRLGWVHADRVSAPLVDEILALRDELRGQGVDRVVLAGMGGSSLAPEVITIAAGVPLHVLDTTDPQQLRRVLDADIERTVLVVSSKSGSTLETDSQRRAYEAAFRAAGIDPAGRIVIVTDPGSPLEAWGHDHGCRVFTADPHVGGRYSALTAFGLVPSGLAGADIHGLVAEAGRALPGLLADDPANPALRLAAALGGRALAAADRVDKFAVACADGGRLADLPAWIEQLVAESTGKQGVGVLPIAVAAGDLEVAARGRTADVQPVSVADRTDAAAQAALPDAVWVTGPLGAQFAGWEVATAAMGLLLGIDPFDQPDVESAKAAARALLEHPVEETPALLTDGTLTVSTPGEFGPVTEAATLDDALAALFDQLDDTLGYVAVQVYADRIGLGDLVARRDALARALGRPVTFGWGPRFLHSTGQYHKGGPAEGVFLQLTRVSDDPLAIPERPFGFARLIRAQATGDAQVLAGHDLPVLRIESTDDAGLARALDAAVTTARARRSEHRD